MILISVLHQNFLLWVILPYKVYTYPKSRNFVAIFVSWDVYALQPICIHWIVLSNFKSDYILYKIHIKLCAQNLEINSDLIFLAEWSVRSRKLTSQTINRILTRMHTSYLDNCPRSLSKCHRQIRKKQLIFWTQFSNLQDFRLFV